jgi:hypothetical protein
VVAFFVVGCRVGRFDKHEEVNHIFGVAVALALLLIVCAAAGAVPKC